MQSSIGTLAGLAGLLVTIAGANVATALWLAGDPPASPAPVATTGSPNLRLLSERADRQTRCQVFGPFNDPEQLASLRIQLGAQGAEARVLERVAEGAPDYLVYIGPESSGDAVRRIHHELSSLGLDNYVIANGSLHNAVAVGLFTREELAVAQQARVRELGYEVSIRELPRSHRVYHLLARIGADAPLPAQSSGRCSDIAGPNLFL